MEPMMKAPRSQPSVETNLPEPPGVMAVTERTEGLIASTWELSKSPHISLNSRGREDNE